MAFAVQPKEALAAELMRVLLEQLDNAVRHLASQEADPVETVHETRKALKRVRTMLRLLWPLLGKAECAAENAVLREVGQKLAPLRDTHMLVESTAWLMKHAAGSPYAEVVAPVHNALLAREPPPQIPDDTLHEMVSSLQASRERIAQWTLDGGCKQIRRALRDTLRHLFRRSRRAYLLAYGQPADEHFHNWRKRLKDLYYAACLLHLTRPTKLAPFIDLVDQMTEDLGHEHDLSIVADRVHEDSHNLGGQVTVALLLQLVAQRRAQLRDKMRDSGARLYKRGAKQVARLLTLRLPKQVTLRLV